MTSVSGEQDLAQDVSSKKINSSLFCFHFLESHPPIGRKPLSDPSAGALLHTEGGGQSSRVPAWDQEGTKLSAWRSIFTFRYAASPQIKWKITAAALSLSPFISRCPFCRGNTKQAGEKTN